MDRKQMIEDLVQALPIAVSGVETARQNFEQVEDGMLTKLHTDLMEASRQSDELVRKHGDGTEDEVIHAVHPEELHF